jgi:hypothetical protein
MHRQIDQENACKFQKTVLMDYFRIVGTFPFDYWFVRLRLSATSNISHRVTKRLLIVNRIMVRNIRIFFHSKTQWSQSDEMMETARSVALYTANGKCSWTRCTSRQTKRNQLLLFLFLRGLTIFLSFVGLETCNVTQSPPYKTRSDLQDTCLQTDFYTVYPIFYTSYFMY